VDQFQLQAPKKVKKKLELAYVSGCSLERRVTEKSVAEASIFALPD
jgi:hypothetical protein